MKEKERMQERTARAYREKFRDKIVRLFAKIYRFVEKNSRKTREEKVSKNHGFKPFPSGLGLKTCFKFLHKKIEVTRIANL